MGFYNSLSINDYNFINVFYEFLGQENNGYDLIIKLMWCNSPSHKLRKLVDSITFFNITTTKMQQ